MSFWERLRRGLTESSEAPAPSESERAPDVTPAASAELDADAQALSRLGRADGPDVDETLAMVRRARGTASEARVLEAVLRATQPAAIDERLRVACAELLAARGEEASAVKLLATATSIEGLILRADLAAARGQFEQALSAIERVLARDLRAEGARERHARWRRALGLAAPRRERRDEASLVSVVSGPFRLVREAARGGSGTIYEAEDTTLGRPVALKVYHRRGADREAVTWEARVTAALTGPGVVRVFDASPDEGWIALEWLAGGSLRDALGRADADARPPLGRWTRELAHALARVHRAGFVHGDVKPANVMLRGSGDAVLSDFSIARRIGAPATGGSTGYLSPERLGGSPSDPSDDVYAFGRVLEDLLIQLDAAYALGSPPNAYADELGLLRTIAAACLEPRGVRYADGAELARALP
jgi:serine/threonine-protein kinase